MDGVRLNQAFGDVVMWDLIPKAIISSVSLMSGANPLCGLNTLGARYPFRPRMERRMRVRPSACPPAVTVAVSADLPKNTVGQLDSYVLTPTGGYRNSEMTGTTFYMPGAPHTVWVGARYTFQ